MKVVDFSENLIRLRREHKITQEEVADFIGVTRAAVSKWENGQSLPDVLLLPQLANYFDVTVDELLGYKTQLSKEQIQKIYIEICRDFAEKPIDDVLAKLQNLVHRYYSCYPFLLQAAVLYVNHFMLFEDTTRQQSVLHEGIEICQRIISRCNVVNIVEEAVTLKTMFQLQLGQAQEVVEILEPLTNPMRMSYQNETVLIQAYQMLGDIDKAQSFTQIVMYLHIIILLNNAMQYLQLYINRLDVCEKTIERMQGIIDIYNIAKLRPDILVQFYYQTALVYATNQRSEEMFVFLEKYQLAVHSFFRGENIQIMHGDDYFDGLDEWIEKLALGSEPPRNIKFAAESTISALENPLFQPFQDSDEMKKIKEALKRSIQNYG